MSEKGVKPINILTDFSKPVIKKQMEGVYNASLPITGMVWFETGEGTVLIDTLTHIPVANQILNHINEKIKKLFVYFVEIH